MKWARLVGVVLLTACAGRTAAPPPETARADAKGLPSDRYFVDDAPAPPAPPAPPAMGADPPVSRPRLSQVTVIGREGDGAFSDPDGAPAAYSSDQEGSYGTLSPSYGGYYGGGYYGGGYYGGGYYGGSYGVARAGVAQGLGPTNGGRAVAPSAPQQLRGTPVRSSTYSGGARRGR